MTPCKISILTCTLSITLILACLLIFQIIPLIQFLTPNKVILISMDGFRHDYIELVKQHGGKTPNFDFLIKGGSRIMKMKNAFPTITLPNHQTLLTGLYPENHGIVLNTFIDQKSPNVTFDMNNQDNLNDKNWFVNWPEPIWVTLQKTRKLSASHLWPLTDAEVNGEFPFFQESQYTSLDNSILFPFKRRTEDIARWMSPKQGKYLTLPVQLGLLYFPEPDETGHAYGPNSQQIRDKVMELDGVMGNLITYLKKYQLFGKTNIILTADHGMSEISNTREIALDEYIPADWYTYTLLTPISAIYPKKGKEQAVYNGLKGKNPHLQVFWRQDVPASLMYNKNDGRIAPLIAIADNGWSIVHTKSSTNYTRGNHGYNNSVADVHPFFIAYGPDFRQNYTKPSAYSVDVYSLMCHLLNIKANKNDGELSRIQSILKSPPSSNGHKWFRGFDILILDRIPGGLNFFVIMLLLSLSIVQIIVLIIILSRQKSTSNNNTSINSRHRGFGYQKLSGDI